MKKVLIIDDDTFICALLEKLIKDSGYDAETAFDGSTGISKIKSTKFDLILCDFRLPDTDGFQLLKKINKLSPSSLVIIITAYSDVRVAVKLMKAGAKDYITKPLEKDEIKHLIERTLKSSNTEKVEKNEEEEEFVFGDSKVIRDVLKMAELVAPTDMSVLIEGETGSGKEYIARVIHNSSKRSAKRFVAVDCGAIPKELASSELFGHVKGAFTGAISDKVGVFENAKGGTLFLDEVGNLPYEVQVKLLRALQEKVITRVGDTRNIKIDVRIIAATNEDIKKEVVDHNFREDLYHRLNEFKINIPALRDRKDDIMVYANHFLGVSNQELNKNVEYFSEDVENIFLNYEWHGNLRELRNIVKRSVLLAQGNEIDVHTLPEDLSQTATQTLGQSEDKKAKDLKDVSYQAERRLIIKTLKEVRNNKSKAARVLNIDRKTLYNKLKQYDIDPEFLNES